MTGRRCVESGDYPAKIARWGDTVTFNWSTVGPGALYLEAGAVYDATHDHSRETLEEAIYGAWDRGFRLYSAKNAGERFETRVVSFQDLPDLETVEQWEVHGPIARILGQREHGALEAFREAYRSFELPVSGTTLVLREHVKVLRAFTDVLSEETGAGFEWEVVPKHGFYLRPCRSVYQTRQQLQPWVLSVLVFEITTEDAGGSVCVNHADIWDPCGPDPVSSRFLDTQALQKQLAAALSLPVFRRNIRVLLEMDKVHDRG